MNTTQAAPSITFSQAAVDRIAFDVLPGIERAASRPALDAIAADVIADGGILKHIQPAVAAQHVRERAAKRERLAEYLEDVERLLQRVQLAHAVAPSQKEATRTYLAAMALESRMPQIRADQGLGA